MSAMRIPTSVSLALVQTLQEVSSAFVLQVLCCLIMDEDVLILARASVSLILRMGSVQCQRLSTPRRQSVAAVKCQEKDGVILVSSAQRKKKLLFRTCVLMVMGLFLELMIHVRMLMNASKAQGFVQMDTASTPTDPSAASVQWVTT
ncbi:Fibrillin-2-like protein [Aix galericulata]|nr:Fibrillin-2-like protein [Aix galericulata]